MQEPRPEVPPRGNGRTPARLVVSIVAYKEAPLTIDCLASIEPELASLPPTRVIVVDNASPDGAGSTVARAIAERGWSGWAELVPAPGNHGFAAGNNIAIRRMLDEEPQAEHILLLNPDTLVRPGALRRLIDFVAARPEVGMAGGRSEDLDATPQVCCFRFPSATREILGAMGLGSLEQRLTGRVAHFGVPEQPVQVDWVSGAFVLFRRQVIEQIGLMDEGYFLYYEETDYLHRAQRVGWQCWHVPDSRVVHLVGQSSGVTNRHQAPRRLPAYWFESRRRYFVRHHGRAYAAWMDLALLLACPLGRLRHAVQGKPARKPPHYLRDMMRHSALWRRNTLDTSAPEARP